MDTDHSGRSLAIAGLPGVARCLSVWAQEAVAVARHAGVARWRTPSGLRVALARGRVARRSVAGTGDTVGAAAIAAARVGVRVSSVASRLVASIPTVASGRTSVVAAGSVVG